MKDLWELDLLGIRDPIESKRTEDLNQETLDLYNSTVKRESNGSYIHFWPPKMQHPEGSMQIMCNLQYAFGAMRYANH